MLFSSHLSHLATSSGFHFYFYWWSFISVRASSAAAVMMITFVFSFSSPHLFHDCNHSTYLVGGHWIFRNRRNSSSPPVDSHYLTKLIRWLFIIKGSVCLSGISRSVKLDRMTPCKTWEMSDSARFSHARRRLDVDLVMIWDNFNLHFLIRFLFV